MQSRRDRRFLTDVTNADLLTSFSHDSLKGLNWMEKLQLAASMRGYDYQAVNPAILKLLFKRSVWQALSIDTLLKLLVKGH